MIAYHETFTTGFPVNKVNERVFFAMARKSKTDDRRFFLSTDDTETSGTSG
jgi:hypothetical protein